MEEEALLTIKKTMEILGVSRFTLDRWRRAGKLHVVYPLGRPPDMDKRGNYPVRFKRSEVIWMLEHMDHDDVTTTDQAEQV